MKVALCFAGQPRDVVATYNNIVKNLIIPNGIEDIFVHTWYRPEFESQGFGQNSDDGRKVFMNQQTLKFIEDNYKPKKILIQNDLDIKFYSNDQMENFITEAWKSGGHLQKRWGPCYYSRYISSLLKNEYKKEVGLEAYDAVIISRFDNYFRKEINLKQLDLSKINAPVLWRRNVIDRNYVGDLLTIGNEKNVDIYCDIYNHLPAISKNLENFFPERFIGQWFIMNDIEFCEPFNCPEDVVMYRDK